MKDFFFFFFPVLFHSLPCQHKTFPPIEGAGKETLGDQGEASPEQKDHWLTAFIPPAVSDKAVSEQ